MSLRSSVQKKFFCEVRESFFRCWSAGLSIESFKVNVLLLAISWATSESGENVLGPIPSFRSCLLSAQLSSVLELSMWIFSWPATFCGEPLTARCVREARIGGNSNTLSTTFDSKSHSSCCCNSSGPEFSVFENTSRLFLFFNFASVCSGSNTSAAAELSL